MMWLIRNTKTGKFAIDTRGTSPLIVLRWGARGDAELLTEDEYDRTNKEILPKHWQWVRQGDGR